MNSSEDDDILAVPERAVTGKPVRVFISAGEKSGDLHAASLIQQMARTHPEVRFEGFGGDRMEAAGCQLHSNVTHLSGMGLSFLSHLVTFVRLIRRFYRLLREHPPEALLLVDAPGFNFILARIARWRGVPVVYYICPQIWAWAPWRREKILRLTDLLMVIFPFETEFYRSPENKVVHVGHPLADELSELPPPEELAGEFRRRFSVSPDCRIVGLFPGSRTHEIRELLPLFARTVSKLDLDAGKYRLMISCCREDFRDEIERTFRELSLAVDIVEGDAYPLMAACHLALVASGTATLELAFFEKPMVVFYKIGRMAYSVYRLICTSPYVSLVNILGREEVVPEEITYRDNSSEQAERARELLEDTAARALCVERLADLRRDVFKPGGSRRAAETLARFLVDRRVLVNPRQAEPSGPV